MGAWYDLRGVWGVGAVLLACGLPCSAQGSPWREDRGGASAGVSAPVPAAARRSASPPVAQGVVPERLRAIREVLERAVHAGAFPGAVAVIGRSDRLLAVEAVGQLAWSDTTATSPWASVYDVASLTKVVATTAAAMLLVDRGLLDLDVPVGRYRQDLAPEVMSRVTMRHLLQHTSGLPAGLELWRHAPGVAEAWARVRRVRPSCAPGRCQEYSDVGADIAGLVVEAIAGEPLSDFVGRMIYRPLSMTSTRFRPPASWELRIAPTATTSVRGYGVRGEVHDDNAWALGGIAGHAGVFSTAGDLAQFARWMLHGGELDGVRVVSPTTVAMFLSSTVGQRAVGWQRCMEDTQGHRPRGCGRWFSRHAFGHLGFTGTSLWIDPVHDVFVVLLTNRVFAPRLAGGSRAIADVRDDLSDVAVSAIQGAVPQWSASAYPLRSALAAGWTTRRPQPVIGGRRRPTAGRAGVAAKSSKRSASSKPARSRGAPSQTKKPVPGGRAAPKVSTKVSSKVAPKTSAASQAKSPIRKSPRRSAPRPSGAGARRPPGQSRGMR